MQVSIEKAELHWTTNSEANRLRHWIWKKPIVQHCNMVHDRMVMIWKVQWCSWINQNESFSIISKLQNEKRKESRLYYISKRYLTLDFWAQFLPFWPAENPNVWECIYEPLGGSEMQGTIFGFRKTPKKVNFMLCTFATKTFKHLGRKMVFFNPQRAVLQWLDSFSFQVFQVIFCGMERGKEGGRNHRKRT